MRNLTIKRIRSFVGCLAKMKIYIEDYNSCETFINSIPCRKIGELKNGEEKTFVIGEQAAKIFVIADKLTKDYCNEYYQLSDGGEDVFLSGKNRFNPANGNAFRFNNNETYEVLANRRHATQKGVVVLIAAIIIGAIVGYLISNFILGDTPPKAKNFYSNGISVTLTDEFIKMTVENYTVAYESPDVAVIALKEEFSSVAGLENYTLEQYGDLVIKNSGLTSIELKTQNQLKYFEYEFINPETKDNYRYFSYIYKTEDAFWLVQFATLDKNAEEYAQKIAEWARTVRFLD